MKTYHEQPDKLSATQTATTKHMKGKVIERMARNSILLLFAGLMLPSCNDGKLTKAAEGTWQTTLQYKDEYGNPLEQELVYTFKCGESGDNNHFIEQITQSLEEEADDFIISYTAISTIEGDWEVLLGDLHTTYDMSTLEVTITDVDYELSDNISYDDALDYFESALGAAMFGQELIDTDELAEEIRKEAYKTMYTLYENDNANNEEGGCYPELKIEGDIMSFNADEGLIKLVRVNSQPTSSIDYMGVFKSHFPYGILDDIDTDEIIALFSRLSSGKDAMYENTQKGFETFAMEYFETDMFSPEGEDMEF